MPRPPRKPVDPLARVIDAEAVNRTLAVLGGKWTIPIVATLLGGTHRFTPLSAAVGPASPKVLVRRLRALEAEGLVTRVLYPEIPPRVEYSLTPAGETLAPIIAAIEAWGITARSPNGTEEHPPTVE